eukprot:4647460-Prymnesium_polylepis.1
MCTNVSVCGRERKGACVCVACGAAGLWVLLCCKTAPNEWSELSPPAVGRSHDARASFGRRHAQRHVDLLLLAHLVKAPWLARARLSSPLVARERVGHPERQLGARERRRRAAGVVQRWARDLGFGEAQCRRQLLLLRHPHGVRIVSGRRR